MTKYLNSWGLHFLIYKTRMQITTSMLFKFSVLQFIICEKWIRILLTWEINKLIAKRNKPFKFSRLSYQMSSLRKHRVEMGLGVKSVVYSHSASQAGDNFGVSNTWLPRLPGNIPRVHSTNQNNERIICVILMG